jgi:hypothetical protein
MKLVPPDKTKSPTWVRATNVIIALIVLMLLNALKDWYFGDDKYEPKMSPAMEKQIDEGIRKAQQEHDEKIRQQWIKDHPEESTVSDH